jgi:hypothetical protein
VADLRFPPDFEDLPNEYMAPFLASAAPHRELQKQQAKKVV